MKSTQNKNQTHFGKDDVRRNSSILYGQLGLVLALLLTYLAIESKTLVNNEYAKEIAGKFGEEIEEPIPDTTPIEKLPKLKEIIVPPAPILDELDIIKNDVETDETVIDTKIIDPDTEVKIPDIVEVVLPEEDTPDIIIFSKIKEVPVFPGCTGTTEEIKQCFSKSVQRLVSKKFNADLAQELNLSPGKKRIAVQFTIDKQGIVTDIKVRAPHKRLEKETKRVVSLLPKMEAGKYKGKPIKVKFTLPITLEVFE
jgi:protein TonB